MVTRALRSLWVEPRPRPVPRRGSRDWALAAGVGLWSVLETALRSGLAPLPLLVVAALAAVGPLLWRRTQPLAALLISIGTLALVDGVRLVTDSRGELLNSSFVVLVLVFALFRWGSGRECTIGLVVILGWLAVVTTLGPDRTTPAEAAAGFAFFLFAAAVGTATRYRATMRVRDLDRARSREREQLARELHDTVAHHVSGIAIHAQAGRAIATTHPDRAVDAFTVIEEAATRTLTELRSIVGALRAAQDGEFAPQPGIAEVEQLATDSGTRPRVTVSLSGDLDDLSPAVGAAVYRLTQEAVTNARRHARHATHVQVAVSGDEDAVRLSVEDDGSSSAPVPQLAEGFGLVGMAERTALLGGTFHAGPQPGRGWRIDATLPRAHQAHQAHQARQAQRTHHADRTGTTPTETTGGRR